MKKLISLCVAGCLIAGVWFSGNAQVVINTNLRINVHEFVAEDGSRVVFRVLINTNTGEVLDYSYEVIQVRRRVLL
jgi:hypothetical protein